MTAEETRQRLHMIEARAAAISPTQKMALSGAVKRLLDDDLSWLISQIEALLPARFEIPF